MNKIIYNFFKKIIISFIFNLYVKLVKFIGLSVNEMENGNIPVDLFPVAPVGQCRCNWGSILNHVPNNATPNIIDSIASLIDDIGIGTFTGIMLFVIIDCSLILYEISLEHIDVVSEDNQKLDPRIIAEIKRDWVSKIK